MQILITFEGTPARLTDRLLDIGDTAPEARVVQQSYEDFVIGGAKDKPQLILTVPTLDGDVCPKEIEQFDEILREVAPHIYLYVVSMDLPHAQRRYCVVYSIKNLRILSDFRYRDMQKYGVLIADGILQGLLARAAFVIDTEGRISYVQLVKEQLHEPDYEDVRKAIERVLSGKP